MVEFGADDAPASSAAAESIRHQDSLPESAACRLDATEKVHVRTNDSEVEPPTRSDVAVTNAAVMQGHRRVDANTVQNEPRQFIENLVGSRQRLFTCDDRIGTREERKHGIAHELEDFAACAGDGRHHEVEVCIQEFKHLSVGQAVRQFGKAAKVAKQKRGLTR